MYKIGTYAQYLAYDNAAKLAAGWTALEIANGKEVIDDEGNVSYNNANILKKLKNPYKENECMWECEDGDIDENGGYNTRASWIKKIQKPISTKYYIEKKEGDSYCYGYTNAGNYLNCGINTQSLEIFDSEADYLSRLDELEINTEEL